MLGFSALLDKVFESFLHVEAFFADLLTLVQDCVLMDQLVDPAHLEEFFERLIIPIHQQLAETEAVDGEVALREQDGAEGHNERLPLTRVHPHEGVLELNAAVVGCHKQAFDILSNLLQLVLSIRRKV